MVLTSASLENAAYGAFPSISAPNIRSTENSMRDRSTRCFSNSSSSRWYRHPSLWGWRNPAAPTWSRLSETGNGIPKKNFLDQNYREVGALLMNDSSCIFEIIYNTLQQSHNTMSVKTLCEMAGVSRSGYYAWLKAAPSRELREQQDRDDFELILAAYKMHGYSKGAKASIWLFSTWSRLWSWISRRSGVWWTSSIYPAPTGGRILTGGWPKP
mgnify:CR=1 FL=1